MYFLPFLDTLPRSPPVCPGSPYTHTRTCTHAHTCTPGHRDTRACAHVHAHSLEPWSRSVLTPLLPRPGNLHYGFPLQLEGDRLRDVENPPRATQRVNGEAGGQPEPLPHPWAPQPPPCASAAPVLTGSLLGPLPEPRRKTLLSPPPALPSRLSTQHKS